MKKVGILLTGLAYWERVLQMTNKYNINFSQESVNKNITRLVNQCWKLIPMKENEEDWAKQLNTVTLEVIGLNEIFLHNPIFLQLLSKLEGLKIADLAFEFYRKTVFEIIGLMQKLKYE